MDGKSMDVTSDRLEQLKAVLPEAFSEGKIDWEKLQLALGEDVQINDERYVLNWAGKNDAFHAIQTPTTATLAPDRNDPIMSDEIQHQFIDGKTYVEL